MEIACDWLNVWIWLAIVCFANDCKVVVTACVCLLLLVLLTDMGNKQIRPHPKNFQYFSLNSRKKKLTKLRVGSRDSLTKK